MKLLWFIISFLLLLTKQSICKDANHCPEECKCKYLMDTVIMHCTVIPIKDEFYSAVSYFEIAHSEEPLSIRAKHFANVGLTQVNTISITNVSILQMSVDAFKELPELTEIKISHTNISHVHSDIFLHNLQLKKLNLSNNPFHEHGYFLNSNSVEELDLSNCNLTKLERHTFQNLSRLTFLDISGNNISNLIPGTFDYLTDIIEIRASNNFIFEIPEDIFENNINLESLYLENNPISTVSSKILPDLIVLNLQSCQFSVIKSNTFSDVENLDLSNNKITEIEDESFKHVPSLTTVNLEGNYLKFLSDNIFLNNYNLERIILDNNSRLTRLPNLKNSNIYWFSCQNCGLQTLGEKTFQNMKALVTLKLAYNNISYIPVSLFHHLTSLTEVDLSYNQITVLEDNTFKYNLNLRSLIIAGNPLKTFHARIFRYNKNLQMLNISNCSLNEIWAPPKIEKLSSLEHLIVANNKIEIITKEDIAVSENLKVLDISGNRHINCLSYYKIKEYLIENEVLVNQYVIFENLATSFDDTKDMVPWNKEELCPNRYYGENIGKITEHQLNDYEIQENDIDNILYLPNTEPEKHLSTIMPSLWIILVFITSVILVIVFTLSAVLFVVRCYEKITNVINIQSISTKLEKNSGFVYQQLSEDRSSSKTSILERFRSVPRNNSYCNEPECV